MSTPAKRKRPRVGRRRFARSYRRPARREAGTDLVPLRRPLIPWPRRSVDPPASREPGRLARGTALVVVRVADAVTRFLTRLLGADASIGRGPISETELRELVAANAALDGEERRLIDEVFSAGGRHVREVMVPRPDVVFLWADSTVAEAVEEIRGTPHSRFPVIGDDHDDVVGFVHLRDLLLRTGDDPPLSAIVRDVRHVPASRHVLAALSEMRREGHHLAVVVDEYGGTAGIVTLEDLLEELVGEIHDEYDAAPEPEPAPGVPPESLDGRCNLADFAERCGFALPHGPYETVGGFVMAVLGRIPRVGDEVPLGPYRLVVTECDGRRVSRVAIVGDAT